MERVDIGDDKRLNELVDVIARGEEVILVRAGEPVARLQGPPPTGGALNLPRLIQVRKRLAAVRVQDGGKLIRELRDAADH